MRTIAVGIAAIAGLIGTSALAADMPVNAPRTGPVPAYSWTGCYVGGNAGGIWEHDNTPIGNIDPTGIDTAAFRAGAIPNGYSYERTSWLAGGQLGCNYQVTNWVLGIETDFDGTRLSGEQTINTAVPGFFPVTSYVTQKMDWIGTTRGRLGITAFDSVLFYGTGGAAYAHVFDSYFLSNVPGGGPVNSFASDSTTLLGWTAGGGVEVGFGQWSVKGEALYYDLADHSLVRACTLVGGGGLGGTLAGTLVGAAPCATPNTFHPANFENRGVIARVGLNYHFK